MTKMFEKKRCPNCGEKVKSNWRFCPSCGEELAEERDIFDLSEEIEKEMRNIDKFFASSLFKLPRRRGFPSSGISITIHSMGGREPKVEIKTTGEYKKVEPEIKRRLGIKPAIEEIGEKEEKIRVPKITEEPETKIENIGRKQIIKIKLPDVKPENLEVKRLEQSIEVKAFVDDKAYFKLIPIPPNASVSKEFKNNILKIEIER
ncbi:MAG: zinc ribbon domain-containing protein [Candidatus Aenigmatarchaeota archaeon]